MKKRYIPPHTELIASVYETICTLRTASVVHSDTGQTEDTFDVNEDGFVTPSGKDYRDFWGGD